MSTQQRVRRIRGTSGQNAAATLPEAVFVVKTPIDGTVWVHDGSTAGGFPVGLGAIATPVTVPNGGTSLPTLTAHAVLLGEGTSAVAFATVGTANRVLADNGASADPSFKTITALLDAAFGNAQGDILYRDAAAWMVLAPGTSGYLLQTQGASANPQWAAPAAAAADSVTTGITAAGTNQSGATALTTQQNYVNTGVNGTHGVRIASSLMTVGGHVFVSNEDASNSLLVYPDTGIAINSLGSNNAITVPADTTAQFIVKSSTALRSVP